MRVRALIFVSIIMKKVLLMLLMAVVSVNISAQIMSPGYKLTSDGFRAEEICKITFNKGYAIQGM